MSNSPIPSHPAYNNNNMNNTNPGKTQPAQPAASDQDWALRLEQERRMTQQLAAKNEALSSQQQFVVERAADFALQQQHRIAELEAQLGAAAPAVHGDAFSSGDGPSGQNYSNNGNQNTSHNTNTNTNTNHQPSTPSSLGGGPPINVRHGCPRCSTCSTLLQTVGQLETMMQNRDSDCDVLRKALDDAQRVNALLLEQIDLLQRGLERALINRVVPQSFHGQAPQLPLHHSVSPPRLQQSNNDNNNSYNAVNNSEISAANADAQSQQTPQIASFTTSNLPANVRMLQPSSEPTLRAMADAVASLQGLWLDMSSSPGSSRYKQPPAVPPKKLEV